MVFSFQLPGPLLSQGQNWPASKFGEAQRGCTCTIGFTVAALFRATTAAAAAAALSHGSKLWHCIELVMHVKPFAAQDSRLALVTSRTVDSGPSPMVVTQLLTNTRLSSDSAIILASLPDQ